MHILCICRNIISKVCANTKLMQVYNMHIIGILAAYKRNIRVALGQRLSILERFQMKTCIIGSNVTSKKGNTKLKKKNTSSN